jgi:hypothetical protein
MNLETRVEILEKEVEILKGEIQALLLDMQDHLLSQAHPELRGVNAVSPEATQTQQMTPITMMPTMPIQQPYLSPRPVQEQGRPCTQQSRPMARLGNNGASRSKRQPVARDTEPRSQPEPEPDLSLSTQIEAEPPVIQQPKPESRDYDADDTSPTLPAASIFAKGVSDDKLRAWTRHKLGRHGSSRTRDMLKRYVVEGRINVDQHEMAMDEVERFERYADRELGNNTGDAFAMTAASGNGKVPERGNIILRLIAGVQNAGIGMSRRGEDG